MRSVFSMVVPLPVAFIRFLISINRFWKFQYDVEEIATRLLDFHYNITVVSIFIIILVRSDMQLKSCFKFIIFEVFCNKCDGTMLMCHWNAFLCSLVYTDYKKKDDSWNLSEKETTGFSRSPDLLDLISFDVVARCPGRSSHNWSQLSMSFVAWIT